MPRSPRLHVPNAFYHVTLRGNHQEALFETAFDRLTLNGFVIEALEVTHARLHAFCWMTNHIHALLQVAERRLGETMQLIAQRYSFYRHRVIDKRGQLFDRRHYAKLIDADEYFINVLRYIHLNPVAAGIVADPADYAWSSHRTYLGLESRPWVTTDFGLSLFSQNSERARHAYGESFGRRWDPEDKLNIDLNDPGIDSRVLGNEEFVARIVNMAGASCRVGAGPDLRGLATMISLDHGISVEMLCSRSSARPIMVARRQLLQVAVEQRVATPSDVARFLNRHPAATTRLARRR
jgi:putative transposase